MRSGVVLAGGKSTRMGVDKCTLLFCGKPLIFWPVTILGGVVDDLLISVSARSDTTSFDRLFSSGKMVIVKDNRSDVGPLMGIYSALKKAKGEYAALSPCDSPLIQPGLYKMLFENANGCDGAVPLVKGLFEPLHGVYKRTAMISAIECVLEDGLQRPVDTFKYLNIKKMEEEDIKKSDPNLLSFLNINSLSDVQTVSAIFQKERDLGSDVR